MYTLVLLSFSGLLFVLYSRPCQQCNMKPMRICHWIPIISWVSFQGIIPFLSWEWASTLFLLFTKKMEYHAFIKDGSQISIVCHYSHHLLRILTNISLNLYKNCSISFKYPWRLLRFSSRKSWVFSSFFVGLLAIFGPVYESMDQAM